MFVNLGEKEEVLAQIKPNKVNYCCGETIITPVGKIIKHDEKNTYLLSFVNICQITLL